MKGVVVITPEDIYEGEDEVIAAITNSGSRVHIRKPKSSLLSLGNYCERILNSAIKEYITVNREQEIVDRFGLGGIHVPYSDIENTIEKLVEKSIEGVVEKSVEHNFEHCLESLISKTDIKQDFLVSCSTHSYQEAHRADCLGASYYFLSPIYDSISKHGYLCGFDDGSLREFTAAHGRCVALGGVDITKLDKLTHFYSVALLGAVWQIDDGVLNIKKSIESFKNINDRWQELKSYTI